MPKFARGDNAVGICARSGRKMLRKNMVPDGQYPNLLVDPAWRDMKHPQEKPVTTEEGIVLNRPAPDTDDDSGGDSGETVAEALFPDGNYFGGAT